MQSETYPHGLTAQTPCKQSKPKAFIIITFLPLVFRCLPTVNAWAEMDEED